MSPARSEKQRRYLFWKKGEAWTKAHHFDKLAPGAKKPRTLKRKK